MRLTRYFLPILREEPSEAHIASHRLLLRAGLARQTSAGIYAWLPLGFRVLRKIIEIVRAEQDRAGAIELLMPTLQPAQMWQKSGRYDDYGDEMLRIKDRAGREMLYGPTNEEMITEIFSHESKSWRDAGRILYHIQWKFRDEIRPRFGVLRAREFLMKDGYSFDLDRQSAERSYQKMFISYLRIFARLGVPAIPVAADTGPIGGDLSHEFVVLAETGESEIYCHRALKDLPPPDDGVDYDQDLTPLIKTWTQLYAAESEKHDPQRFEKEIAPPDRLMTRGIEVGHIFYFGEKYTKPFDASLVDAEGVSRLMHCGSYGIGISRLVGAIIEASHDDKGIIWPEAVAPFAVGLVNLAPNDEACVQQSEQLYQTLTQQQVDVLYDDRDERAGAKLATMDLIGLPRQIVIGPRNLKKNVVELKSRRSGESTQMAPAAVIARLTKNKGK